jgi:copper chaperone CopZ
MVKQIFRIADMHCTACVMRLEDLEDERPGIKRIRASYQKQQMEVEYETTAVTQAQIMAAMEKKSYTPSLKSN